MTYLSEKMTIMSIFAGKIDIILYIHIYSVFGSAFIKEVLYAISSFSKICLTSNYKYQGNYITKTKLIIDVTVISVY